METVRYYVSATSSAGSTPNPNDRILYREVDGAMTIDSPGGVTSFVVKILDEFGSPITDLNAVRMLDVELIVESPQPYDTLYTKALWEKRFAPRNLFKRTLTDFGP